MLYDFLGNATTFTIWALQETLKFSAAPKIVTSEIVTSIYENVNSVTKLLTLREQKRNFAIGSIILKILKVFRKGNRKLSRLL